MYLQRFFSPPLTLSKNNWKVFLPPTPCRLDSQSDVEWLFKVEAVKSSPTPWLVVPKVKKGRLMPKMRLVTRQQIPHPNMTAPAVPGFVAVVNAVAISTDWEQPNKRKISMLPLRIIFLPLIFSCAFAPVVPFVHTFKPFSSGVFGKRCLSENGFGRIIMYSKLKPNFLDIII